MSGPYAAPWTDTGRIQGDIDRLESQMHRKVGSHEMDQAKRDVDRLELTVREFSATLDGFRFELQSLQESHRQVLEIFLDNGGQPMKPNQPDRYNCGIKRHFPNPFWVIVGWFMSSACVLHYKDRPLSLDWRFFVGGAFTLGGSIYLLRYIMGAK